MHSIAMLLLTLDPSQNIEYTISYFFFGKQSFTTKQKRTLMCVYVYIYIFIFWSVGWLRVVTYAFVQQYRNKYISCMYIIRIL